MKISLLGVVWGRVGNKWEDKGTLNDFNLFNQMRVELFTESGVVKLSESGKAINSMVRSQVWYQQGPERRSWLLFRKEAIPSAFRKCYREKNIHYGITQFKFWIILSSILPTVVMILNQGWFCPFPHPKGHVAISGNILGCHSWG